MPKEDTQFSKTRQPAKNGRKPSHLKKYMKANNMGLADVRAILGGILTNIKSIEDVKKMLTDPKTPPIVLFPLKALLNDFKYGRITTFQFLAQYGYGMPKQEVESTSNVNLATSLSKEDRDALKDELIKKLVDKEQ